MTHLLSQCMVTEFFNNSLAPLVGIEPTAFRVETERSIQLSYKGMFLWISSFVNLFSNVL